MWSFVNSIPGARLRHDGKLGLIVTVARWSKICQYFLSEIESSKRLESVFLKDVNPILIEMDERLDLFLRYNAGALPSIMIVTPDLQPLWANTYSQLAELENIVEQYVKVYKTRRTEVERLVKEREDKISQIDENFYKGSRKLDNDMFQRTVKNIVYDYDAVNMGFGKEPKLPFQSSVSVLLAAYEDTGGNDFSSMLRGIRNSYLKKGLIDRNSGVFFRGCIDESFGQPIEEKLSYDSIHTLQVLIDIDSNLNDESNSLIYAELTGKFIDEFKSREDGLFKLTDHGKNYYKDVNCNIANSLLRLNSAMKLPDILSQAEAIFSTVRNKSHNLTSPNGHRFLRDEVSLFRLGMQLYANTSKKDYLSKSMLICDEIQNKFLKESLNGLSDVISLNPDEGIRFSIKDIEDNALYADSCLEIYKVVKDPEYLDRAVNILTNFPDQGNGYGHWTANYALAVRKALQFIDQ